MGPRSRGTSVPFRVFVHGQPPSAAHGLDVDEQGRGTLIQQAAVSTGSRTAIDHGPHTEITFLAPCEAYAFTFS